MDNSSKKSITILCVALIFLFSVSCGDRKGADMSHFSEILYSPEYASGFEIRGADGYESSLISVTNPWQGADNVSMQLFIARKGESAPEGFKGQVLKGDARRIIAMSSTNIAMLDAVGAENNIVGVSGIDFVTNPKIQSRRDSIGDVGFSGNINYELLLSLNPDLVLLYGINGATSTEKKLEELGIPYLYVGDYVENSPLGKAEWLIALAEITGKREKGEEVFSKIHERYEALRTKVADTVLDSPSVMLNTPYGDAWFMPSAGSYIARLIADACGNYIYDKDTGNTSEPIDIEEAYRLTSDADFWLNTGSFNSLEEVKNACPKFTDTRCFRNGDVYNNTLRSTPGGGNDFFESGVVNPDLVLRDLVKIFHPELVEEDFVYYKKLK